MKVRRQKKNRIASPTSSDTPSSQSQVLTKLPEISRSSNNVDQTWKRRKRGRLARVANIQRVPGWQSAKKEDALAQDSSFAAMTTDSKVSRRLGSYSTTLTRRAIRKIEDLPEGQFATEEYGDISLGMKLIVAGGKVIVQTLNSLQDGRASPAQLSGFIQRGDVLLAVGDSSLEKLPIDQLMTALGPLSTAETSDGRYRRSLKLKLETGTGLELLELHEKGYVQPPTDTPTASAVNEMFALFPMVDQLSGTPLFESSMLHEQSNDNKGQGNIENNLDSPQEEKNESDLGNDWKDEEKLPPKIPTTNAANESDDIDFSPDQQISSFINQEVSVERNIFVSKYFILGDEFPNTLRESIKSFNKQGGVSLTRRERIDIGEKVMKLTKNLTYNMEDIDKGKDLRSFKMWSTNFSIRSGASTRRRVLLDAASLRSHRRTEPTASTMSMDESIASENSGSLGSVDGDTLLLGLAAHDDIWREQVIAALEEVIQVMNDGEENKNEDANTGEDAENIDAALSNGLGNFLFGEKMNQIVKKRKKTHALPPEDITTVLFDLVTHITTSAPDEVTMFGSTAGSVSFQSSLGTNGRGRAQMKADINLATRFVLDEVLPVWLQSFRPLGLQQRHLLWPKYYSSNLSGGTNGHDSDNDSLTVGSDEGTPRSLARKNMNLQELVGDLELDIETRSECCFLVTYYFTQQVLNKYSKTTNEADQADMDTEALLFLQKFGAYLQIHSCLVLAANVEADIVIDQLLEIARHDPFHRASVKDIAKASTLTMYDAKNLPALLLALPTISFEAVERQQILINLSVAAYPDIQPWQMKKACFDFTVEDASKKPIGKEKREDLFYNYLSSLLDPVEGNRDARRNGKLLKQWCEWSTGISSEITYGDKHKDWINNFYKVTSRSSSAHLSYRRDLVLLLEMSMQISEHSLALELVTEIIENRKLCSRDNTIEYVLVCLRKIAGAGLQIAWKSRHDQIDFHLLKRVLRSFHHMASSEYRQLRESTNLSGELLELINIWDSQSTSSNDTIKERDLLVFIDFLVAESTPVNLLMSFVSSRAVVNLGPSLYFRLQTLLRRGAYVSMKEELSGTRLRLQNMREEYSEENQVIVRSMVSHEQALEDGIWKRVALGTLTIDK